MNKLREEVLLKIEEMGLLLSKEVRDRILEERNQRKSALAEFDLRVRDFVKAVSQNQAAGTNKLSKRLTTVVKSVDLCEASWKSAVTSVASVVRTLQPGLDDEISQRELGDREVKERLGAGKCGKFGDGPRESRFLLIELPRPEFAPTGGCAPSTHFFVLLHSSSRLLHNHSSPPSRRDAKLRIGTRDHQSLYPARGDPAETGPPREVCPGQPL